jgi:hypothetical protein
MSEARFTAGEWHCYSFTTLKAANGFVADIAEGYRVAGVNYVQKWERPKRKKGGYWVAVAAKAPAAIDHLAAFYGGQDVAASSALAAARGEVANG